jgi:hypothetical protein
MRVHGISLMIRGLTGAAAATFSSRMSTRRQGPFAATPAWWRWRKSARKKTGAEQLE